MERPRICLAIVACLLAGCASPSAGSTDSSGGADRLVRAMENPDNLLTRPSRPRVRPGTPEGGTLRRRLVTEINGFNFVTNNSATLQRLQSYLRGAVAARDLQHPDQWVPDLAYKVTANDKHTVYTVHLRRGVRWHTPRLEEDAEQTEWMGKSRTLTAEDFKFAVRMIQHPKVEAGAVNSFYEDIESVEIVDDHTFKVHWNRAVHHSRQVTLGMAPVPKWLYTRRRDGTKIPADRVASAFGDHWAHGYAVGVGPYRLVEYKEHQRVVLERVEDYFDARPAIEKIVWKIEKSDMSGYFLLKAGKVDFTSLSPKLYDTQIRDSGPDSPFKDGPLEHRVVDGLAYYYIGWNNEDPRFADPRVRRAMTHALRRPMIIEEVRHGLGHLQTGPFFHGHPANNPDVDAYAFDLDRARTLLEEAGWRDRDDDGIREKKIGGQTTEFQFTLLCFNTASARKWTGVYKDALRKIGVDMRRRPQSWTTLQERMAEGDFQAYTGGWALSWQIDPYQIWHSSQADVAKGSNHVGFRDDRADAIIEKLRVTFNPAERRKLLREFHALIHRKQPYTFLWAPQKVYAWRRRLRGVSFQSIRPQALSLPWYIAPDGRL